MLRLAAPILLLIAVIIASVWSDRPMPRADVTVIERSEVHTTDLHQASWTQDLRVLRAVYEGLLKPDIFSVDQHLIPAAARSLPEISPDALTYTFHLRPDALWSSGEPVRASDFVYAWRRGASPDASADYVQMFMSIRGMKAWHDRRRVALARFASEIHPDRAARAQALWESAEQDFRENVAIATPDDHTIRVELARALPYFAEFVAFVAFFPLHERSVRAYESLDPASGSVRWASDWTRPPNLIGNGPLRLVSWRFKRDMRLETNPFHWNHAAGTKSVTIKTITDTNAGVLAFRTGAADWNTDVAASYRGDMLARKREFHAEHAAVIDAWTREGLSPLAIDARLPPDPRNTIHELPAFGTYFLNLNCAPLLENGRPNPLADARVRRALARCVDKREIVTQIRRTAELPTDALIPPGSIRGYTPIHGLATNVERARAELADAGFPRGAGLPPLEYLFTREGGHDLIAQAIKRQWEQALGVRVELVQLESKVFSARARSGKYMISRASWFGDYADPTTFLDINRSDDNNNDRQYRSARYDAILDQAATELVPATRMELLRDAERLVLEADAALIPIFHYTNIYQFDAARLHGLSEHPRQEQHLFELWLGPGPGGGGVK